MWQNNSLDARLWLCELQTVCIVKYAFIEHRWCLFFLVYILFFIFTHCFLGFLQLWYNWKHIFKGASGAAYTQVHICVCDLLRSMNLHIDNRLYFVPLKIVKPEMFSRFSQLRLKYHLLSIYTKVLYDFSYVRFYL